MVPVPLHHGGVLTAPRWSFYGTMVEWHRHRGVFPDFTTVKCGARRAESGKPAGIFQLSRAATHILRSEFSFTTVFFPKSARIPNHHHHGGGFLNFRRILKKQPKESSCNGDTFFLFCHKRKKGACAIESKKEGTPSILACPLNDFLKNDYITLKV